MSHNPYVEKLSVLCKKASSGGYFGNIDIHKPTGVTLRDVDWSLVERDVIDVYREVKGDTNFPIHSPTPTPTPTLTLTLTLP